MYGIPDNLTDVIAVEVVEGQPIYIKVTEVHWEGHYPHSNETIFAELTEGSSEKDITIQIKKLLKRKTYIRKCEYCNLYHINGWMHGKFCCQSCAENKFGVIY